MRFSIQSCVVLNHGKGVVEVVQESLPILILSRTAKPLGVMFQRIPPYEQQIAILHLEASLQVVPLISGHLRDDLLGLCEGHLEFAALPRLYI